MSKVQSSCAICHRKDTHVQMFNVPSDPVRRKRWSKKCSVEFHPRSLVCELHFTGYSYTTLNKKKYLNPQAVPRVQRPPGRKCQTNSDPLENTEELENLNLKKRNLELQSENHILKEMLSGSYNLMDNLKTIFKDAQIKKLKSGGKGVRWTDEDMLRANKIFRCGGRVYNHLYDEGYPIPALSKLKEYLARASKIRKPEVEPTCSNLSIDSYTEYAIVSDTESSEQLVSEDELPEDMATDYEQLEQLENDDEDEEMQEIRSLFEISD